MTRVQKRRQSTKRDARRAERIANFASGQFPKTWSEWKGIGSRSEEYLERPSGSQLSRPITTPTELLEYVIVRWYPFEGFQSHCSWPIEEDRDLSEIFKEFIDDVLPCGAQPETVAAEIASWCTRHREEVEGIIEKRQEEDRAFEVRPPVCAACVCVYINLG